MSQCAICSPAGCFLYHVTANCKGRIELQTTRFALESFLFFVFFSFLQIVSRGKWEEVVLSRSTFSLITRLCTLHAFSAENWLVLLLRTTLTRIIALSFILYFTLLFFIFPFFVSFIQSLIGWLYVVLCLFVYLFIWLFICFRVMALQSLSRIGEIYRDEFSKLL